MKHQNVLRILVLVLAIAMMLVVASCNGGGDKSTTPEQTSVTTPKPTTPEVTTPDNPPEHVHTEEVVAGKDATCSETGLTEGKVCSVCGETLVEQEVIEKLPHTEEVVAGKDATCSATGLTEGKVCSVCGDTIVAQETIEKLPHTEEVIPGKAASCTETGLTEGKVCSVCGDTIVAQETIPVTDHTYVDGVCSVCGTPDPGAPVYCDEHVYQSFEYGKWGICTICSYVDDNHEHIIKDGKCQYCDFEIEEVEVPSVFDNDGDGVNDVYLFAAALPEKFRAEGVV
ncbi:MAG: hypothetical protein IJB94_03220, partial [Clostridia bacterium]|nr:hypothetical protein [Clostridia bacterium]